MTIYDIKERSHEHSPYFFSRKSMSFFGQTLKSFSVTKQVDGRILISAPMKDRSGKIMGYTERFFNPDNNKLELN